MTGRFTPQPEDCPVILTVPTNGDMTSSGTVLGGWIMTQIDHAAGRAGRLFAGDCVIRAIHDLIFHAPLRAGEELAIFTRIGTTGRTSFRLEMVGMTMIGTAAPRIVVDTEMTMICVDAEGRPRPLAEGQEGRLIFPSALPGEISAERRPDKQDASDT